MDNSHAVIKEWKEREQDIILEALIEKARREGLSDLTVRSQIENVGKVAAVRALTQVLLAHQRTHQFTLGDGTNIEIEGVSLRSFNTSNFGPQPVCILRFNGQPAHLNYKEAGRLRNALFLAATRTAKAQNTFRAVAAGEETQEALPKEEGQRTEPTWSGWRGFNWTSEEGGNR